MKRESKRTSGDNRDGDGNVIVITISDIVMSALEDAAAANETDVNAMVSLVLNDWVLRRDAMLKGKRP